MTENIDVNAPAPVLPAPGKTITLRLPKLNAQVVVLGLVAFITLFQTFQLVSISRRTGNATVKAVSTPTASQPSSGGSGSAADVPQSMVGGC